MTHAQFALNSFKLSVTVSTCLMAVGDQDWPRSRICKCSVAAKFATNTKYIDKNDQNRTNYDIAIECKHTVVHLVVCCLLFVVFVFVS